MTAVFLDWSTMRELANLTDPVGILSIYVTLDRHERAEAGPNSPWELRMRHQLGQVRDRLKQDGPREHAKALNHRLDELRLELERLLDPSASGQGRALFTAVAGGEVRSVSLQVPLADQVVLEPRAYLRPLVAAWSTAGPAGAVSVSADELRVVDLRFGLAEVVDTIRHPGTVEQRELKGPANANPALPQQSVSQHDLFERREEDKLARSLRAHGPRLAELVRRWGWDELALTGEAPLVQALREGLPPSLPAEVVTLDLVNSLPPARFAATAVPALTAARQRRHRALAEQARNNALSANAGAWGLGETLGALQQGRVAHLLLDAGRQWSGSRTPDGFLTPDGEVPPGLEPAELSPEPHLAERMLELAFRDGGRVTMLDSDAVTPLADADGIGAVLRW